MNYMPRSSERNSPGHGRVIAFMYSDYLDAGRCFFVSIGNAEDQRLMDHGFRREMSVALIERLLEHGNCAGCGGRVADLTGACPCGHTPRHAGVLELTVLDRAAEPCFDKLLARWLDGHKSAIRREREASLPRTLTDGEVQLLLTWQRDLCFYCGEEFLQPEGMHSYRKDHVIPVLHGGPTTIENTVLACVRCNSRKGSLSARQFVKVLATARGTARTMDHEQMLRTFRKKMKAYVSSRAENSSPTDASTAASSPAAICSSSS